MKLTAFLRYFFGLLYPNLCAVCGNALSGREYICCLSCLYHLPRTNYWKEPGNPIEQIFWGLVPVEHVCALFFFSKGSRYRKLLHKLKYKGMPEIGVELGRQLGLELKNAPLYQCIDTIIPVPLHPKRQRRRGYNQSERIAAGIAQITGWKVNTSSLVRTRFTGTQTRKSRQERWENVSGAFALQDAAAITNRHVLLVDDVLTTGATMEACILQLKKAAGCKVSVATLACTKKTAAPVFGSPLTPAPADSDRHP
ncbi:MAG: ComF family protein [Prevotellaceae bacterium]|jgi:ComF family protein|nr:ComF family protein [Prevotellaceae bacterium]